MIVPESAVDARTGCADASAESFAHLSLPYWLVIPACRKMIQRLPPQNCLPTHSPRTSSRNTYHSSNREA